MIFKKLFKAAIILIFINVCATSSLEPDSLQDKTLTTAREEPAISVTTERFHRKQRQSRCFRCYEEGGQSPESEPRYGSRYGDDGDRYNSRNRYYSPYPSKRVNYDDSHNWYNQNDRYDRNDDKTRYYENRYPDRYTNNRFTERDRYSADRYSDRYPPSGIRNDDRYYSRTFDHYDSRQPIDRNRYDPRQELYNNRGYDQRPDYRPRFNERERPYDRVRTGSYYNDRNYEPDPYDRHNYKEYDYDYRNYRPVDETHRAQGYHPEHGNANNDLPPSRPYNNPNHLPHSNSQMSHNPYLPISQSPPRPLQQSQNSSKNLNHDNSPDYQNTRLQPDKNANNDYAGDWSYVNDRNKAGFNTEKDSSPYGGRSRPGSYLFDRKSNTPTDSENKNDLNNTAEKTASTQNDNDKKADEKINKNN